jgi:hypothetical protein
MLFSRFSVSIDGEHLAATLWGEPVDVMRHSDPPPGAQRIY